MIWSIAHSQRILNMKYGELLESLCCPLHPPDYTSTALAGLKSVCKRQMHSAAKTGKPYPMTVMCSSVCPALELQIFGSTKFSAARGSPSATAGCRLPQTRVEELQGKWSVHLLRSPHFLNCRLIVQADHNLTGCKERIVASKLVKWSWGCRYFPTYTAFPSLFLSLLCFFGLTFADWSFPWTWHGAENTCRTSGVLEISWQVAISEWF